MGKIAAVKRLSVVMGRNRPLVLLLYAIAGALLLFFLRDVIFFLLLAAFTGGIAYAVNRFKLPYDLSPVFPASVLVMSFYGPLPEVFFLALAFLLPSMLAGAVPDFLSLLAVSLLFGISYLAVALNAASFPIVLVAAAIYAIATFATTLLLTQEPGKAAATFVVAAGVNFAYIAAFYIAMYKLGTIIAG